MPLPPRSSPIYSTHKTNLIKIRQQHFEQLPSTSRREILKGGLALMVPLSITPPPPTEAKEVVVGSYLPQSPSDPSFNLFKATPKDTPALRAGKIVFILSFISN